MTDLGGLRIGLLTASASRLGGGVFEAVAAQAALIRARGGEAPVFALHDAFSDADAGRFARGVVTHVRTAGPAAVGYAPDLLGALLAADLDCLHLHGIWMYPSRAGSVWAARTARPYAVSPHGMLAPWITARGRARKRAARLVYERASWRRARLLHALNAGEAADIARESGRRDVCIIPNAAPPLQEVRPRSGSRDFVYIGRIHPKKNLGALLRAWTQCRAEAARCGARLTIAGWGEDRDIAALRSDVAAAGERAAFVGPVYGAAKAQLLAAARFAVLPSLSEGLPMAILEAWAAGVPALISRACNLDAGFAAGAALDCGTSAETIAAVLRRAMALDDARWSDMTHAARALAAGPFGADSVAEQWAQAYRAMMVGNACGAAA